MKEKIEIEFPEKRVPTYQICSKAIIQITELLDLPSTGTNSVLPGLSLRGPYKYEFAKSNPTAETRRCNFSIEGPNCSRPNRGDKALHKMIIAKPFNFFLILPVPPLKFESTNGPCVIFSHPFLLDGQVKHHLFILILSNPFIHLSEKFSLFLSHF
ncbi:hypothetical protein CDL12_28464 [Handroanthus impetiginosus]|uniref:Uncharacterized protein n=1 Tax=Handroanthus impetiginosus TaxID=429701 RepID=A0A2G9G143_9LAMI|nr:hypothetical protein CDL12_28464 [Handroanthus impetiginosus]